MGKTPNKMIKWMPPNTHFDTGYTVTGVEQITGMEVIQVQEEEVVDCEPLAVQIGDMLEGKEVKMK
jgi:hypothetical protein